MDPIEMSDDVANVTLRKEDAKYFNSIKKMHDKNVGYESKNNQFVLHLLKEFEDVKNDLKDEDGKNRYLIIVKSNLALTEDGIEGQLEKGGFKLEKVIKRSFE